MEIEQNYTLYYVFFSNIYFNFINIAQTQDVNKRQDRKTGAKRERPRRKAIFAHQLIRQFCGKSRWNWK